MTYWPLITEYDCLLLIERMTAETTFRVQDCMKKRWHDAPLSVWWFQRIFRQLKLKSANRRIILKLGLNWDLSVSPQPTRFLKPIRAWSRLHKSTRACINGIHQRYRISWGNTDSFKNRLCKRQWAGDVEIHPSLHCFSVAILSRWVSSGSTTWETLVAILSPILLATRRVDSHLSKSNKRRNRA